MNNPIDLSKLTIPNAQLKFAEPWPNNIVFYNTLGSDQVEVLRISKDGVTANPDVPVDEAAAAVLRALDGYIKTLTQRQPLTDEQCDAIYKALDAWAREFDQHEFGLPATCGGGMEGGRAIIRAAHGIKEKNMK